MAVGPAVAAPWRRRSRRGQVRADAMEGGLLLELGGVYPYGALALSRRPVLRVQHHLHHPLQALMDPHQHHPTPLAS